MTFQAEWLRSVCAGCARSRPKRLANRDEAVEERAREGARRRRPRASSRAPDGVARRPPAPRFRFSNLPPSRSSATVVLAQPRRPRAGRAEGEAHAVALRVKRAATRRRMQRAGAVDADHEHVEPARRRSRASRGGAAAGAGQRVERGVRELARGALRAAARDRSRRRRRPRGTRLGRGASAVTVAAAPPPCGRPSGRP